MPEMDAMVAVSLLVSAIITLYFVVNLANVSSLCCHMYWPIISVVSL